MPGFCATLSLFRAFDSAPLSHPPRSEDLSQEMAAWLVSEGRTPVNDLVASWSPTQDAMSRVMMLRHAGLDQPQSSAVLAAAAARVQLRGELARAGWPSTEVLLSAAAAEQASHPMVARHRARRFADGPPVIDLGCGAGIDAVSIARSTNDGSGVEVHGVDLDPARLTLAAHNARVGEVPLTTSLADALETAVPDGHRWHADPGRRRNGRRSRTLAETQPPTGRLAAHLAAARGGAMVMSPAIELRDPDLPDCELEFVQVGHSLIEAVGWLGDLRSTADAVATIIVSASAESTDIGGYTAHTLQRHGVAPEVPTGPLRQWLLDPAPALARARLHHEQVLALGGHRLSMDRALCTSEHMPVGPWWTSWLVEAELPGRPRALKSWAQGHEAMLPVSIELHGDVGPIEPWWHALRGHQKGPIGHRIHVIGSKGGARCVVTRHASLSHVATGG